MPTKEEKHHSSSTSSGSNGSSGSGGSGVSGSSGTEKHKYCFLCNRNEFTLKSFDPTIEKDLRVIYNTEIKFKENRKVCLQCLHVITLLKRSIEDEKKYNECCKDFFENVTYLHELRNKYQRYVNRLIDNRNKDKDSPKKTSEPPSNQSTPATCSPESSVPSTSPDVTNNTTPKPSIKLSQQQQQQQLQQQQPIKLDDKSVKMNARSNGKSLADTNHCKDIERLQNVNYGLVKVKDKEKEKDTVKSGTVGGKNSTSTITVNDSGRSRKNKYLENLTLKKDKVAVQDSEKQQKSPAKINSMAKEKLIEEATKSNDVASKSNKRRLQNQKTAAPELNSINAECETKTKLSNISNISIVNKASITEKTKNETLIVAKGVKPTKMPTNTKKTRVQRSNSPKQQIETTSIRQQRSCTFEQALTQVETTRSKTRTQTQKESVLTQTPAKWGPTTNTEVTEIEKEEESNTDAELVSKNETDSKLNDEKKVSLKTPLAKERFESTIINGKQIEVPARVKFDMKMFNCYVKLSRKPFYKRKFNGTPETLSSPPMKKRKRNSIWNHTESEVRPTEIADNDELCNTQQPRSILQKLNRSKTPVNGRKRVSFLGVPSSPPQSATKPTTTPLKSSTISESLSSKERSERPEQSHENDTTTTENVEENEAKIETPKAHEKPKVAEKPTDDKAPKAVETLEVNKTLEVEEASKIEESPKSKAIEKVNETVKEKETPNKAIQRPKRTKKRITNEILSINNIVPTAVESPLTIFESNDIVNASVELRENVVEENGIETSQASCSEDQLNSSTNEAITSAITLETKNVNDNVSETVNFVEENAIITESDDNLQTTTDPIKKKRKPYQSRTKPTSIANNIIVEPVKVKEKQATKRQRKQVDKVKKTKNAEIEAKDDIEIVNLEDIKRNIVIENVLESVPSPFKAAVDETDEDEVKLLIEADPLALETDSGCTSPVHTPISVPISIPISVISTPVLTPVSTPTSTPTPMPTPQSKSPKPKLDRTSETSSKVMTVVAPIPRSHESSLKIKISNGKVVQSETTSSPQSSPLKGNSICRESSPKAGARYRTKRVRKKKYLSPDYVEQDLTESESEESPSQPPINERKKRKVTPLSKRLKEKEAEVCSPPENPSTNVVEVEMSVDQRMLESQPSQLSPQVGDRVYRAYVRLDKINQQNNGSEFAILEPHQQQCGTMAQQHPAYSQSVNTQTEYILRPTQVTQFQPMSQANESLLHMNNMNGNNGCVTTLIHNVVGNMEIVENESESHTMNVIQNYTNEGLNNDGMYEVQETTVCENGESPTVPIVQTDNNGTIIGFESPATVDSTTSGYSSATATSSVYLVDPQTLNHSIGVSNGFNSDFNMQHMQLETFPFVEIQTSDIIDILGKTNDCNDALSMENINLDTTADTRTYYLTDEHAINTFNAINTINTVAHVTQALPTLTTGNILGVFRTKASLKQIDPPPTMHFLTDSHGHAHIQHHTHHPHHHHHHLQHSHMHGHGSSAIPNDLSGKMLRTDNPILNAVISGNEESSMEMQDADDSFSMTVDSMVTSSDTVQATQRRPGLNVVFSTPSKRNNVYLSNENVSIDEFISESQSLLNPDNFPTTTTNEESHLDFYTLGM